MTQETFAAAIQAEESGDLALARRLYQESLEFAPSIGSIWLRYIGLLEAQRDYAAVIAAAEQALSCEVSDESRALMNNLAGRSRLQLGELPLAEAHFRSSRQLHPSAGTCVFLYSSLRSQARADEGVELLREALALDPRCEEALYQLGCYHRAKGQLEAAEASLRAALEIDPEYSPALAELGVLLSKKGELAEAGELFVRAIERAPRALWARMQYAKLLWRKGEHSAAEEQYQRALALFPKESLVHWSYGQFLSETERDEERAEALLQKAVELSPEDAQAHQSLGRHLLRYGRFEDARREIEVAITLGAVGAGRYLTLIKKHLS